MAPPRQMLSQVQAGCSFSCTSVTDASTCDPIPSLQSIKVAPADGLHTGIPVPEAGPAPTPAPAPAPSAAARAGARASASVVLLSAVAAGALLLA